MKTIPIVKNQGASQQGDLTKHPNFDLLNLHNFY